MLRCCLLQEGPYFNNVQWCECGREHEVEPIPDVYPKEAVIDYIIRSTPIYPFFQLCESALLERTVLDCGAGGKYPPLTLFRDRGYATCGIEISKTELRRAQTFCKQNAIDLNIFRADMRRIPFADASFSFVYAYESIFFLTEPDIAIAVSEIERELDPKGLCFITFRSVDDTERRAFPESHHVRTLLESEGLTYHEDNEPETYFCRSKILRQTKRIRKTCVKGRKGKRAYLDYTAQKL